MKVMIMACNGTVDYSYGLANAVVSEWKSNGNPGLVYLMPTSMHATEIGRMFFSLLEFLKTPPMAGSDILVCVPNCGDVLANYSGLCVADNLINSDDLAFVTIDSNRKVALHGYTIEGYATDGYATAPWSDKLIEACCGTVGLIYGGSRGCQSGWLMCDYPTDVCDNPTHVTRESIILNLMNIDNANYASLARINECLDFIYSELHAVYDLGYYEIFFRVSYGELQTIAEERGGKTYRTNSDTDVIFLQSPQSIGGLLADNPIPQRIENLIRKFAEKFPLKSED